MRKGIALTLALVSLVGLAVSGLSADGKKIVIGVSFPTQREEIWVKGKEALVAEAEKQGVTLKIALADADTAQQANQVENLFAQGIDALILAPVDSAAASTLVDKANAEGIPVISYARLALNSKVDYYVTFDNFMVGELQGKFLTEKVPSGNIIVMSGAPTDNIAGTFKQGAMKYITPLVKSGKIKIVAEQAVDNWLPENALKIVENALTQNKNNIQGILAPNDGTAGGAIQALQAQGLVGKVVVTGQDAEVAAIQRVIKGEQSMTIFKDIREVSKASLNAAVAFAKKKGASLAKSGTVNNGKIEVPTFYVPPTIITKDNAVKVLITSGYMTKEQLGLK